MKRCLVAATLILGLCAGTHHAHACSTVYFNPNGQDLIGHNMDWFADRLYIAVNKRNVKKHGFVFPNDPTFTWTSKYGSISLVMEGLEITGRGMNEAGLVILEMAMGSTQQSTDSKLPRLSVGQWAQYQLDTSATIEDVIASDKVVRISAEEEWQSHFLLWDSTGKVALVEWLNGEMTIFRDDTLPVPVFVNSAYEACTILGDDPSGRHKKMVDKLATYDSAKDRNGVDFVYSILQESADMLGPPLRTLWQLVVDPRGKRMYFRSADNSNLRYVDLKDLDFSCRTPVEMFDFRKGDAGNVRSLFVPFSKDLNAELVRYIFGIYQSNGIPTSDQLIEKIIAYPDSLTCLGDVTSTGGTRATGGTTSTGGITLTGGTSAMGGTTSTGGTASTGGTTNPKADSAGCSCSLGAPRETRAFYAGLLLIGFTAWIRGRRRRK